MFIATLAAATAALSLQASVPVECNIVSQGDMVHVSCNDGKGFTLSAVYEPDQISKTVVFAGSKIVLQSIDNTLLYDSKEPAQGFFRVLRPEGVRIIIEPK